MTRALLHRLLRLLLALTAFAVPAFAFADAAASLPTDAFDLVGFVVTSFKAGGAGPMLGVAGVLALVVQILKRILPVLSPAAMPWVSAAIGMLAAVGTNFAAGGAWTTALLQGVVAGLTASGLWSLVLKHVAGWVASKTAPAPVPAK
jgi:hypothetical protein